MNDFKIQQISQFIYFDLIEIDTKLNEEKFPSLTTLTNKYNYYNKYIKYKNKYIALKQMI